MASEGVDPEGVHKLSLNCQMKHPLGKIVDPAKLSSSQRVSFFFVTFWLPALVIFLLICWFSLITIFQPFCTFEQWHNDRKADGKKQWNVDCIPVEQNIEFQLRKVYLEELKLFDCKWTLHTFGHLESTAKPRWKDQRKLFLKLNQHFINETLLTRIKGSYTIANYFLDFTNVSLQLLPEETKAILAWKKASFTFPSSR